MAESFVLLENPRKRRKRSVRGRARRADGRFKKKASGTTKRRRRRVRRRNPATVANPAPRRRRRRRATTVAVKRRRRSVANPAHRRRRSRRRNPSAIRSGGKVLSFRRAMNIVQDAGGLVAAEFLGQAAARLIWQRVPFVSNALRSVGVSDLSGPFWMQLVLGIVGGPTIRRFAPRGVRRVVSYWELANAAMALHELTRNWREEAYAAMGVSRFVGPPLQDWVTTSPQVSRLAPPVEAVELSDWATVGGSSSYTGDPFSAL